MSKTPGSLLVGAADAASEATILALTGIPPQIQRSFFKAVERVFTASAEIPAQWLEDHAGIGRARRQVVIAQHEAEAADIRSQQKGRDIVNRESAKAAALQFKKEDLAARAVDFHAAHIIREQEIREDVIKIAAVCLADDDIQQDSEKEIDDDWLNIFLKEASNRSQDEFKQMFGRILAGEVKAPGTFSIATIQIISRLTKETASIFQIACNLTWSGLFTPKVVSDGFGDPGSNCLQEFGLSYFDLARLVEAGLIRTDFREWQEMNPMLYEQKVPFDYAGITVFLAKDKTLGAPTPPSSLRISGPTFTRAGEELRRIITVTPVEEYLKGTSTWFKGQGLVLYKVYKVEDGQMHGQPI